MNSRSQVVSDSSSRREMRLVTYDSGSQLGAVYSGPRNLPIPRGWDAAQVDAWCWYRALVLTLAINSASLLATAVGFG